jgi:anti-sigma factor RsiW
MSESSKTECQTILAGISAYLDGELDSTACDAIERHCQTCPRCAALVNGLRETVGLCRQAASVPFPESVRQRARASVRRLLDEDKTRHSRRSKS